MYWKRLTSEEIKNRVFAALHENLDYRKESVLGLPGTHLDEIEFYNDAPFLEQAAFLSAFIANPNHIGCHTLMEGEGESAFKGTQKIEAELINLCAEEIFGGSKGGQDGYVASGGTEANIEAVWIYRNYYREIFGAKDEQMAIVYSEDSHYSISKAVNLFNVHAIILPVEEQTRMINEVAVKHLLAEALGKGYKYFILVLNLGSTMFGSVDEIDTLATLFENENLQFRIHIDAAFGGFIYPFTCATNKFTFRNKHITSISIDAHKLLQAPYGTGIFLIRKGWMQYVKTAEAYYVPGTDYTLCGSRSGANAIAVWMILMRYGSEGWKEKMDGLISKKKTLCSELDRAGIHYISNPYMNIITIPYPEIPVSVAHKYYLVPDTYGASPKWWKIVVMGHVNNNMMDQFIKDVEEYKKGIPS